MKYIKCERCELNYITTSGAEYCDVCLRELAGEVFNSEFCYICGRELDSEDFDICKDCRKQEDSESAVSD